VAALALLVSLPATAAELVGTRTATFEWAPSSGDVYAYAVYVERNGGPRLTVELVQEPRATIEVAYGDEIVVSVRAVGFDGGNTIYSAFSARSEPVRFLAPPRFGGAGTLALHCLPCGLLEFRSITDGAILGEMPVPQGAWRIVDAGDMDGDHERDLIFRDGDTGGILVLLIANFSFVDAATFYRPDMIDRAAVGTGDFDGDGRAEIVLYEPTTGTVELWGLLGDQLGPVAVTEGQPGSELEAVADFNADAIPDLLWRDPATGALEIWTIRDLSVASVSPLGAVASGNLAVTATGDFNDDGSTDLLWRDSADGSLYIWYLQQGVLQREASLPRVEGDEMLDVVGAADFTGVLGEEIILQDAESGDVSVLFPFSEDVPSRLRIATPGARWRIVDAIN